ncbi:flagellar hook-length control protein FliK [Achromobacter seleniivolatilans]|uniref:Flagellar hook-length control protein FliK n=1 Tax=Achromobacter seleniivolatilans TaxID=3047478 RepID=A0ABY9M7E5_9BURK|nr:flagellar hook-length control protein FliK [Achromobacter sp. R39]WMD22602.1 flagellar hook-length control protein FliK [Achromobacter sp. R39]
MTAPLPLPTIAPVAPTSIADSLGAKSASANKKGPSFSDVLAQQRPAQRPNQAADSRPANSGAKTSGNSQSSNDPASKAEGAAAGAIDDAVQTAAQAEAGALAVAAAQQTVTPVVLPQQALEIAAQAAEQVQLARGNAQAAATAMSSGAAVLTAALNSANTAAPAADAARAPVAATAEQAEAALALATRDAQAALPVVTAAVKPGSAVAAAVEAPVNAKPAAQAATPRLTPEVSLPRVARDMRPAAEHTTATLPAHTEEELTAALNSTTQQVQAPAQHGSSAQDNLAQALAAATQRQAAPVVNQAAVSVPVVPVVMQVATPVGGTHWGTELGQQVVMMSTNARQGMQTAELRLDPPDLGPLRVSLNMSDGVASASFVSAHASVRQAIEAAIPQLQQALAQAGISLGQTSVGEQSAQQEFAQQNGNGSQRQSGNGSAVADGAADTAQPTVTVSRNVNALVDTFA